MEEQEYTNPIVENSTNEDIDESYTNSAHESVQEALSRQATHRKEQLRLIEERKAAEEVKKARQRANPDPFEDNSDYFGLITSGKIDNSLESVNEVGEEVVLKDKNYYWNNDKVKQRFIEKYGEDQAESMFDVMYEEIGKQYYNHIAKNSLLGMAGLNTAIFAEDIENVALSDNKAMAMSGIIGKDTEGIMSVREDFHNRGVAGLGDFYDSSESARQFNLDFYKDPDTGEIKQLTPEKIEELKQRDDFIAFKYNPGYLGADPEARSDQRYVTVHKEGDQLRASDQVVSDWDLSGGWLSNNGKENAWYKTAIMAIPKFGAEMVVGSAEAVNNVAMVGSALVAGDSFTGSDWEKFLSGNDAYLRSKHIGQTDEALNSPYTSLDGLTDLLVNVASQMASAMLLGGGVGYVAKGAMGYAGARSTARALGKAGSKALRGGDLVGAQTAFAQAATANASMANIALKAGKVGNYTSKALMTSMAMGDIYQVGKDSGLSNREAASVAALAFAGLWHVLNLSERIWKPFEIKKLQKEVTNVVRKNIKDADLALNKLTQSVIADDVATATEVGKKTLIKQLRDKELAKRAKNIVGDINERFTKMAPKAAAFTKDAASEGLEETSELVYQESLKNAYNIASELWHEEEREVGTGKFFGYEDEDYFAVKMDEAIQSFVGGFLGGGMMGAGRAAFRTEAQNKSLTDIVANGHVDTYVKAINDAYLDKKESRIFEPHEFEMTAKRRDEGDPDKPTPGGMFMTTAEAPNEPSIAELKRNILLEEINTLQANMERDGVDPQNLKKVVEKEAKKNSNKGEAVENKYAPNLAKAYSEQFEKYFNAVNERNDLKTKQLASTDNAIATTPEASQAQSEVTQTAMETAPDKLAKIEAEIAGYVKNMNDITNGLTLLDIHKKEKLQEYNSLKDGNPLSGDDSLFDNINIAQAKETVKENNRRDAQAERAKVIQTTIKSSINNLGELDDLLEGPDKDTLEDGTEVNHGAKKLFTKDKESFKKDLQDKIVPTGKLLDDEKFEEKVREKASEVIENGYDRSVIYKEFDVDPKDPKQVSNMDTFLEKLKEKRVDLLIDAIRTANDDSVFNKLSSYDPVLMVGNNISKGLMARINPDLIPNILNSSSESEIEAEVDALQDLMADEEFKMIPNTIENQFDEINDIYKESFDNSHIQNLLEKLSAIKEIDEEQEKPVHISELIDRSITLNDGEVAINPDAPLESIVNKEAARYESTSLSSELDTYTYKDSTVPEDVINHIDAQLDAALLTGDLASESYLMNARLRSAEIRKGNIKATAHGLVTPYEIKDSYDGFEDFFSSMYFDPIRHEQLLTKEKDGVINSKELEELDQIVSYLEGVKIIEDIKQKEDFKLKTYDPDFNDKVIDYLVERYPDYLNEEGPSHLKLIAGYQSDVVTNKNIPYGNEILSETFRKNYPAPVGQFINLLRAKNDMLFFIENAENNRNIGDVGMSLQKQNLVYTDSLEVYNDFLIDHMLSEPIYKFPIDSQGSDAAFRDDLATIKAEIAKLLETKDSSKETVSVKFNAERAFFKLLNKIEDGTTKADIISNLGNKIARGVLPRFNNLNTADALGIVGEVMVALEYNVDNFYSTYKELLANNTKIAKLVSGVPDALQEKAALLLAAHLGSGASLNSAMEFMSFLEGGLATGKTSYATGVGLKVHQIRNGGYVLFASNNTLQIEVLNKTGSEFDLNVYEANKEFDLPATVELLEKAVEDPSILEITNEKGEVVDYVDSIIYDEASMVDASTWLSRQEGAEKIDNIFRIKNALKAINDKRANGVPQLKFTGLGDPNQNGFEHGQPRIGERYSRDADILSDDLANNLDKQAKHTSMAYNISNVHLFGVFPNENTILRSRPLQAQYRAVSSEIPDTVLDIKNISPAGTGSLVADFEFTTKYGYSQSEGKFLGVNVKNEFKDLVEDSDYNLKDPEKSYLAKRLEEDPEFTIGIASDSLSLNPDLMGKNKEALAEKGAGILVPLLEKYPTQFKIGTHKELQSASISFMIVDMDARSFPSPNNIIDKQNSKRKLYTSVGRGIEHVVIIPNNKFTRIVAGPRDNTVRTHSQEVLDSVVKETREFAISKLNNLQPSKEAKFGINDPTGDGGSARSSDTNDDPTPDSGGGVNSSPVTRDAQGWATSKSKYIFNAYDEVGQKLLSDGSILIRVKSSGDTEYEYHHVQGLGNAYKAEDVKDHSKIEDAPSYNVDAVFKIPGESSLILVDGMFVPNNVNKDYGQNGRLVFYNTEKTGSDPDNVEVDNLNFQNIIDNKQTIFESFGYTIEKEALVELYDSRGNKVKEILSFGPIRRTGATTSYVDPEAPFSSPQEQVAAQENRSNTTSTKNLFITGDKGIVNGNKLVSDHIFGYKVYEPTGDYFSQYEDKRQVNYFLDDFYNKKVLGRLREANNKDKYGYKLLFYTRQDSEGKPTEPSVHLVSYEKDSEGNIKESTGLILSEFITRNSTDTDYKIVELFKSHIEAFKTEALGMSWEDSKDKQALIKTKTVDYTPTVSLNSITPGEAIDLRDKGDKGAVAREILKYDPVLSTLNNEDLYDKETGELKPEAAIDINDLVASLKKRGIYVAPELVIQMNTAVKNVGSSRLLFNQLIDSENAPTTADIVSNKYLLFDKTRDGRTGRQYGWGMVNLETKGASISQAYDWHLENPEASFKGMLSRTKSVEMIELFSTVGVILDEIIKGNKNHPLYKKMSTIKEDVKKYKPEKGGRDYTKIFTQKDEDQLKANIVKAWAEDTQKPQLESLHAVIIGMFEDNMLGKFKTGVGGNYVEGQKNTMTGRSYILDTSLSIAPIKYIIPEDETKYMPSVSFSIDNFFEFTETFNRKDGDGNNLVPTKTLMGMFDTILGASKFKNGIYVELDPKETKDRETYDAVADENKLPGVRNSKLVNTSTVGVTNPTITIPLDSLEEALLGTASQEEDLDEDTTTSEEIQTEYSARISEAGKESKEVSSILYNDLANLLSNLDEDGAREMADLTVDEIYKNHFEKHVDWYASESKSDSYLDDALTEDIENKKESLRKRIELTALGMKNPAGNDPEVSLADLGIHSLEDLADPQIWTNPELGKFKNYEKEKNHVYVILANGETVVQSISDLTIFANQAKATANKVFKPEIASQVKTMIDAKIKTLKAGFNTRNQLSLQERIDIAPVLEYMESVPEASDSMSFQNILLGIKTLEYQKQQAKDSQPSDKDNELSKQRYELLQEKSLRKKALESIPENVTLTTDGIFKIGDKLYNVKGITLDKKSDDYKALHKMLTFDTEKINSEEHKEVTRDLIATAVEKLDDYYQEKLNEVGAYTIQSGPYKGKYIASKDVYGWTIFKAKTTGKKAFPGITQTLAKEFMFSDREMRNPIHIPVTQDSAEEPLTIDAIKGAGVHPYDVAQAYEKTYNKDFQFTKDGFLYENLPKNSITESAFREHGDVSSITKDIDNTYFDNENGRNISDLIHDWENDATLNIPIEGITPEDVINFMVKYPKKSKLELEKDKVEDLNEIEALAKEKWGINLNLKIAQEAQEAYRNLEIELEEDEDLNEMNIEVKTQNYYRSLNKLRSDRMKKNYIENKWQYTALSLDQLYTIAKAKGLSADVILERENTFGDKSSFESKLEQALIKDPDLDVYEFAKGEEGVMATTIAGIVPHIESFLLFNSKGQEIVNQNTLIKDLKSSDSAIKEVKIKELNDSIDKDLEYLKTLPNYNSTAIKDSVSTVKGALMKLKERIAKETAEEDSYDISGRLAEWDVYSYDTSLEEYDAYTKLLNKAFNENPDIKQVFQEAMRQESVSIEDTNTILDAVKETADDIELRKKLISFLEELNYYFNCKLK